MYEGEQDGFPFWSHFRHLQSWWDYRELPNIELFHFADLIENTEREVRRAAEFLEITLPEGAFPEIARAVSFAEMKSKGEQYAPGGGEHWQGGAQTFMYKGTNGRWRDVLSDDELRLYDAACERTLSPDCRKWLEQGGPA